MHIRNPAAFSTGVAHVLTWVVVMWLAFGPIYQGTSEAAVALGQIPYEPIRTTASLIEVKGWLVLATLLVPLR